MTKPNPYCMTCRGTGHKQAPDYDHPSMDLVVVECDCVKDQRVFENIVRDLLLIAVLLTIMKLAFS